MTYNGYIVKRHVYEDGKLWGFLLYKEKNRPDMEGYTCLGVNKSGFEEWVPDNQYKSWKSIFDKYQTTVWQG